MRINKELATNYAVLTPTAVLYWYTTELLLNDWVGNHWIQLVVGFLIVAAIYYLRDVFRNNAPTSSHFWQSAYETAYDYVVRLSCVCYYNGCLCIYHFLMATGLLRPIYVAVLAAAALIYLDGYRNVLGLPILVELDEVADRYQPKNTLTFHPGTQFVMVGFIRV